MKDKNVMYYNKLVVAIKSNGNVLRERDNTVFLPFGEEYTILIKNLDTLAVYVELDIDGTDATSGTKLKIDPNSEIEVKRFIKSGNLSSGNAFKFIKRTEQIEQHRGIKIQDGLVTVRFQFELPRISIQPINNSNINPWHSGLPVGRGFFPVYGDTSFIGNIGQMSTNSMMQFTSMTSASASTNEPGITVPGSVVNQEFTPVSENPLNPEKFVMIVKLMGEDVRGTPIAKPVMVNDKIVCVTCGTVCKTNMNFCGICGTSLNVL